MKSFCDMTGQSKGKAGSQSLVSIIIPSYNNKNTINKCVYSCLRQSYKNLEVLVVDDGSTDGTGLILDRIAEQWTTSNLTGLQESSGQPSPSIRIIHQSNQGASAARDCGAGRASGKYITFVDADDFIGEHYIYHFVRDAEENEADFCICGYTIVKGEKGGKEEEVLSAIKVLKPWQYQKYRDESYAYHMMSTMARFYRMDFWREHGIKFATDRNTRGEDIPVGLYTNYFARKIVITDQTDYYYVQNDTSARHNMRGLKTYSLPMKEISACVEEVYQDYKKLADENIQKIPGISQIESDVTVTTAAASNVSSSQQLATDKKNADGVRAHWYFFELGILRTFSLIQFDLLRGADRETKQKVYSWETGLMRRYFTDLRGNPYVKTNNHLQVPFYQKLAVSLYRLIYKAYISRKRL